MKKQTAVEWLEIQLRKGIDYNPLELSGYTKAFDNLFNQAKAMEKEQIIDAHLAGQISTGYINGQTEIDYYTSTFGS